MTIRRHVVFFLVIVALAVPVFANHTWGNYHWARQSNPFTLKLYDNVSSQWESYLSTAVSDWNQSTVLDYSVQWQQPLSTARKCSSATGVVEVCNERYGQNGWLGIAGIYATGDHITKGYTKLNDTYFAMAQYNNPGYRALVTCQEIGHNFGLAHQDENFSNANLGSCMDYSNDPDGGAGGGSSNDPDNMHPNAHDYNLLQQIYSHLDSTTTVASGPMSIHAAALLRPPTMAEILSDVEDDKGTAVHFDSQGRPNIFVRPITINSQTGELEVEITHIFWAPDLAGNSENAPGRTPDDGHED